MPCLHTTLHCKKCGLREQMRLNFQTYPGEEELRIFKAWLVKTIHGPHCPRWTSPRMRRVGADQEGQ